MLYCLILATTGVMLLFSASHTIKDNKLFRETGKTATLKLAGNGYTEYSKRGSNEVNYTVDEMTYTAETGESVNVKFVSIDSGELAALKAGQDIECQYLPSDMQRVRCKSNEEPSPWSDFLFGLVSLFIAGGIFMNARREKQQYEEDYEEEYEEEYEDDEDDDGIRFDKS